MSTKNLHTHIVPIVIISLGILLTGGGKLGYYAQPALFNRLTYALTQHFIEITPTSNGLAKIALARTHQRRALRVASPHRVLGAAADEYGSGTQVNLDY